MLNFEANFKSLANKADEFGDVDTYAKYLHLMDPGGNRLMELKKYLSFYFTIKQKLEGALDKRYLPWLVSIMEKPSFPEDVKILSWNYDYQVQLAAAQIKGFLESVKHSGTGFSHSGFSFTYFPNLDPTFKDHHLLSMIHLNGIAGFFRGENLESGSAFRKEIDSLLNFDSVFGQNVDIQPLLHFAWEKADYHKNMIKHVINMIDRTTILVVIGNSFPFFNREIDKQIFEKLMEAGTKCRKIYYQDPVLDGQQLKAQFGLADDFNIVHIPQTDHFHIPFEY